MFCRKVLLLDEHVLFMVKARDKLKSSKILFDAGQYGDSVGRSYYAMFLAAKALLVLKGHDFDSHRSVISFFGKIYVRNGDFDNRVAGYLSGTQHLRDNSDYGAIDTVSRTIARTRIRYAEEFLDEASKFLK